MIIVVDRPDQSVQLIIPADETRADEGYYQKVIERHFEARHETVPPYRLVNRQALPQSLRDRDFRDAWRSVGQSVEVDMPMAREIQMARIRARRDERLSELDAETLRALAAGDRQAVDDTEARKQRLRDLPANLDLSGIDSVAELAEAWPTELSE